MHREGVMYTRVHLQGRKFLARNKIKLHDKEHESFKGSGSGSGSVSGLGLELGFRVRVEV